MNIDYHNSRFNTTRKKIYGLIETLDLEEEVNLLNVANQGIVKCRVIYGPEILKIDFEPYVVRYVRSLRLVADDGIDYRFKYADRSAIDRLLNMRGSCDDIIIVKRGLLTDTSSANIAFWDGRQWITPAEPLLEGTCRARLLDENQLVEGAISPGQLESFSRIRIFNAMMDQEVSLDRLRIEY